MQIAETAETRHDIRVDSMIDSVQSDRSALLEQARPDGPDVCSYSSFT